MASRMKAAADQQNKDAAKATKKPATEKKPVTPREDPIKRAERLLAEAKAKAAESAKKQMANAVKDLELGEVSLLKAMRVYNERRDRVIMLEQRTGEDFQLPASASQVLFGFRLDQVVLIEDGIAIENQDAEANANQEGLERLAQDVFGGDAELAEAEAK